MGKRARASLMRTAAPVAAWAVGLMCAAGGVVAAPSGGGGAALAGPAQGPPTVGAAVGPSPVVKVGVAGGVGVGGSRAPTGEAALRRAAAALRGMGPVGYDVVGITGVGGGGEVRFAGSVSLVLWSAPTLEHWRGAVRGQVASERLAAGGTAAWEVQRLDLFLEPPEAGLLRHGVRQIISAEDAGVGVLLDQGPRLHVQWLADLMAMGTATGMQLSTAEYRGTAEVDGRECYVVSVGVVEGPEAGGRVHRVTWYLGANDYFPRRVESRRVPAGLEGLGTITGGWAVVDELPAQTVVVASRVRGMTAEQAEEEMRWSLPGNYDARTVGELVNDPGAPSLAGRWGRAGAGGGGGGGSSVVSFGGGVEEAVYKVGSEGPRWSLAAVGPGREVPAVLTSEHLRGRTVVVGFCSGWAGGGRAAEVEAGLERLRREVAGRAVTVLSGRCWEGGVVGGVGMSGPVARAGELMQREMPVWGAVTGGGGGGGQPTVVHQAQSLAMVLGLDAVPGVVVIGPDGKVLLARRGWSAAIESEVRGAVGK